MRWIDESIDNTTPWVARKLHDKRRAAGCQTDCRSWGAL